jgi:hypothetical protein
VKSLKSVVRNPPDNSSGVSESGTVVPRSKTLGGQGGAAYDRRPSLASIVAVFRFDLHAAIMAHPGTNRKPSIGFLA